MSYTVRVAPAAGEELAERLPATVAAACVRFLYGPLAADPYRVGTSLRAPFDGQWETERGEYRIRYRIDDSARTIDVLDLSYRNQVAARALLWSQRS